MIKIIAIGLIILATLIGCEEGFHREPVSLSLTIIYTGTFGYRPVANASVTLHHLQKSVVLQGVSDDEGKVVFPNLDPGFYSLTAHQAISGTEASLLSGNPYPDSLSFNASQTIEILSSQSDTLYLLPASKSNLIIKEFYYSGSLLPNGKLYTSDQFITIYNNGDSVMHIAGLLLAEQTETGNGYNVWQNIQDSVVVKTIWQIPLHTIHPTLEPGQGIVIAVDAIDHKGDPNGNVNSPVDLSDAEFEFYVEGDESSDLDAPAENMTQIYWIYRATEMNFNTRFGGGILLIRPPKDDLKSYILNHQVEWNRGITTKLAIIFPNTWVLDAVDVLQNQNSQAYKRFPASLDAGFTHTSTSGSGLCISRRYLGETNGIKRYADTNNSTVDFLINQIPNPWNEDE